MAAMRILVRMPNWIGDLVMATPVLIDLRRFFPKAEITAMVRAPLGELLEKEGVIDEVFSFERPKNGFLRRVAGRDIVKKIEAGGYDLGILLTHSFSSAWWFWQGGVKRRVGYGSPLRSWMLTDVIPKGEKEHQVDAYKRILGALGIQKSGTEPRIVLAQEEKEAALESLKKWGYKKGGKLVGINPGAAYGSAKCWPLQRFRSLALKLLEEEGVSLLFFGDGSTKDLVGEICRGLPSRVMNLAGFTSLRELAALIEACTVFVTNDSGPMHLAAALGKPLVALFGSTDQEKTGPYGKRGEVIDKKVGCAPCFRRICPIDFRCMKEIGVAEVLEKVKRYV